MIYLDKSGRPLQIGANELGQSAFTSHFDPFNVQYNNTMTQIVANAINRAGKIKDEQKGTNGTPDIIIKRAYKPRETKKFISEPPTPKFFKRTSKKPTHLDLSIMKSRIRLKKKLNKKE